MLKALIVMPQSSHFGMNELSGFSDKHIPQLAKWSLCSLNEYQAELAKRMKVSHLIDAACWLASTLGLESDELEEAGPDAEAVIRTALLALHCKQKQMPDWPSFVRLIGALRKSPKKPPLSSLPKSLPAEYHGVVEGCLQSLQSDWEKILDTSITPTKLFQQTPAFVGRYFWIEDSLAEIDHFDREASTTWNKLTQGHSDDSSLLTLFICIAAGSPRKTLISEKSAVTLVRKIRKSSWQPDAVVDFIQEHAPVQHQSDYIQMWEHFVQEATATLLSDHDYQLHDALSLLKSECNIST